VVLARTINVRDPGTESALEDNAINWARFGETCLGQALYRHRTVFRNASEAPVWSHLELSYFPSMVPGDAILELVVKRQPAAMDLLRAEILLTTPPSFVLPRDWQGLANRPERQASLEYIQVDPPFSASTGTSSGTIVALPPRSLSGRAGSERSEQWRRRWCSIMTRG
jgi:hypothetical protein